MNLRRLIRFGLVGVVNTGTYYLLYLILRTQIPYLVAHVCAFVLAMIASYFLNCYVTFHVAPSWRTFLLFPLSNVVNFVVTTAGLKLAVAWLGLDERIAPLPVAALAIPITYLVAHHVMIGRLGRPPEAREAVDVDPPVPGANASPS